MSTSQEIKLRITSVRHRGDSSGAIIRGFNENLNTHLVVVISKKSLPKSSIIQKGQIWRFTGVMEQVTNKLGPKLIKELQMSASNAIMLQPSGENLISFIAENPNFKNIGYVKAQKLWNAFGNNLINIIQDKDYESLKTYISESNAVTLIKNYHSYPRFLLNVFTTAPPLKYTFAEKNYYRIIVIPRSTILPLHSAN